MFRRTLIAPLTGTAALALLAGCMDHDADEDAVETDGAFIVEMTAHHEAAIEMAKIAQDRAEHRQIRQLADDILSAQSEEIDHMEGIHQRLFADPVGAANHGTLGMSDAEMGMEGMAHPEDSGVMHQLEITKPFDQAFIDMMVAHHQGAIRMARVQLDQGQDVQLNDLARAIIDAQSTEIEQMNTWRQRWYGTPSPAGGVPPEGGDAPSHESMGHM